MSGFLDTSREVSIAIDSIECIRTVSDTSRPNVMSEIITSNNIYDSELNKEALMALIELHKPEEPASAMPEEMQNIMKTQQFNIG